MSHRPALDTARIQSIRAHLEELLQSPAFQRSRHSTALLRAVVERTLASSFDRLKESVLGIDVFHRPPNFDSKADPVVRIEAGKLRKKLAHFYQNHPFAPLRILIPTGGYVAAFEFSQHDHAVVALTVGPFENLSGDAANDYLCHGIRAEVITALVKSPRVKLRARSSPDSGPLVDGVLLRGSLLVSGVAAKFHTQIISSDSTTILWAETFECDSKQMHSMPQAIAVSALRFLSNTPLPEPVKAPDDKAYEYFLRGLWSLSQPSPASAAQALQCFERAIRIDPSFAGAYTGTARALVLLATHSAYDPHLQARAVERARVALALDPHSPDAHLAIGTIEGRFHYNWTQAEQHFRQALVLDPSNTEAKFALASHFLVPTRRFDEALAELDEAAALDPVHPKLHTARGFVLMMLNRTAEARAVYSVQLAADPAAFFVRYGLGLLHAWTGNHAEAASELEAVLRQSPDAPVVAAHLCLAYSRLERSAELAAARRRYFPDQSAIPPGVQALLALAAGDEDEALRAVAFSIERHDPNAYMFALDPSFAFLAHSPKGRALLARIGSCGPDRDAGNAHAAAL